MEVHEVRSTLVQELHHGQDAALAVVAAVGRAQIEEGLQREARQRVKQDGGQGEGHGRGDHRLARARSRASFGIQSGLILSAVAAASSGRFPDRLAV
jgi:hypothetical protein